MNNTSAAWQWAKEELGSANLGDKRLSARLATMAARMVESPGGTLTEVFGDGAEREGAYRFVENEYVEAKEVGRAALRACLKRARKQPFVYVPIDGTSLTLKDCSELRGLGRITSTRYRTRGIEVMSGIAVAADGTPLGYCAQEYWVRGPELTKQLRHERPVEQKETRHWLTVMDRIEAVRALTPGAPAAWYQLDRGADFKEMLEWAATTEAQITIRAAQDRVVDAPEHFLWAAVKAEPELGAFQLAVKSENREQRNANIVVRATRVRLRLSYPNTAGKKTKRERRRKGERHRFVELTAVHAKEIGTAPSSEKPIEWMLLTNRRVENFKQAQEVIRGYAYRWRVEEFHRTWKTSCGVEHMQLRSPGAIERWAVALAVVAMRIQRLKELARTQPELPATAELSQDEIDALLLHKLEEKFDTGYMPSIGEAVTLIAQIGGYTGKSSGGPPGAQTIGRGLQRLTIEAGAISAMRRLNKKM